MNRNFAAAEATSLQHPVVADNDVSADKEANKEAGAVVNDSHSDTSSDRKVELDFQHGVQGAEAITIQWSKRDLYIAYVLIWFIYFVDAWQQSTTGAFTVYVTSEFRLHSLTATTGVVSAIVGGLTKVPLAKIIDIWGRPQGFAVMVGFMLLGLVMMAGCNNVKTYAAAQVFYWIGYNGMGFVLSVFVADTSQLKNRAFAFAFVSSPYIITVWMGGPTATRFINGAGFRWGFGVFAIVTLIVTIPLFCLFYLNYVKAKKAGLMPVRNSGRTTWQSIKHYIIDFDLAGIVILCAGLSLFLLPFNIWSYQAEGWKSPMIICMIVFGFLLCIAFALYEKYFAPVTFIPFHLLLDRTVIGACILSAVLFVQFYIWNGFFFSFLQVVNGLNITQTTYIGNIYSIGSCFFSLLVGIFIRWTGRFKGLALYFGVPLTILGVGLMIKFRQPDSPIGYIIMCQIFIAFSGGTLVICEQMAAMAATSHQYIAVVLAIEGMFANIGGGIGSSIATAIWTGVFPEKLAEYLPAEEQGNLTTIYGDITVQMSYPAGSPARIAINNAYGEAQKWMIVASTAILSLAIVSVAVWRDIRVKDFKQVKGTVF
ncbi:siderophore iron transporter [Bisporella sp. PMI_857]|nr:siderophore iron transporter [Bisporella sp. PMI_857]